MLKILRRKAQPVLPPHPIDLRPILARAMGEGNARGVSTPQVQRLIELLRNSSSERPAE